MSKVKVFCSNHHFVKSYDFYSQAKDPRTKYHISSVEVKANVSISKY